MRENERAILRRTEEAILKAMCGVKLRKEVPKNAKIFWPWKIFWMDWPGLIKCDSRSMS